MTQRSRKNIEPDAVYKKEGRSDGVVPSKTVSYKKDGKTGRFVLQKPKTHKFENALKKEMVKYLSGDNQFPTKKPVFISIVHGLHSARGFKDCDLDNRAKTILDALKDCIYEDDTQVYMLWTQKLFLEHEQESYYHIAVKVINNTSEEREIINNIKNFT